MNKGIKCWALAVALTALCAGSSQAADEAALAKDLTAVITLLGLPCGQVVNVKHQGENDNLATCKDGNRYRVFVNAEGRVVAEKK
jgi:hypothetical protein